MRQNKKILKVIVINLILLFFGSSFLFSQNITKAEIKKPPVTLVGRWNAVAKIVDGKKTEIESEYIYDFHPNGHFQYSLYHKYDHRNKKNRRGREEEEMYHLLDIGTWQLIDNGKKLLVKRRKSEPLEGKHEYDLFDKHFFSQTVHDAFTIRKIMDNDTVEFIFIKISDYPQTRYSNRN